MGGIDGTKKWTHEFPVWVSRKNNDGIIAQFTLPLWAALLGFLLAVINVFGWLTVGLVELVQYVL